MKEKIKYINIIMILTILLLTIKSNAAMEMKPGTSAWTNITVSESYQQCYDLRNSDTTLGKNTLDPHLTLNSDWATVSYLAASAYGQINNSNNGSQTTIDGKRYNTTTGNASGVINFGKTITQTSSIYQNISNEYMGNLINNKESKYVEAIDDMTSIDNTKGKAIAEVRGWFNANSYNPYGIVLRQWMFGTYDSYSNGLSGGPTFRPVIWND